MNIWISGLFRACVRVLVHIHTLPLRNPGVPTPPGEAVPTAGSFSVLWNGTDCWGWQQLSRSSRGREAAVKFCSHCWFPIWSHIPLKLIQGSFQGQRGSSSKESTIKQREEGQSKVIFSSCSAIFSQSPEMFWLNLYMSTDNSQGKSCPPHPVLGGSLIRQLGWLARFLRSTSLLAQMSKSEPRNMKQKAAVVSGFWHKYSQRAVLGWGKLSVKHVGFQALPGV